MKKKLTKIIKNKGERDHKEKKQKKMKLFNNNNKWRMRY